MWRRIDRIVKSWIFKVIYWVPWYICKNSEEVGKCNVFA